MARDVMVRLDRETVREVDAVVQRANGRRRKSRQDLVNELLARAIRSKRLLRHLGY